MTTLSMPRFKSVGFMPAATDLRPSVRTVGAPEDLSSTTLRPLGLTASAKVFTPSRMWRRTSSRSGTVRACSASSFPVSSAIRSSVRRTAAASLAALISIPHSPERNQAGTSPTSTPRTRSHASRPRSCFKSGFESALVSGDQLLIRGHCHDLQGTTVWVWPPRPRTSNPCAPAPGPAPAAGSVHRTPPPSTH